MSYATNAATARRLITAKGRDVTLRQKSTGTYNVADSSVATTSSDTVVKGVVLDFGAGQTAVRGTMIQAGDKRLLIGPDVAPHLQDHVLIGSVDYVVVSIGELNPGGTIILYDLHLHT